MDLSESAELQAIFRDEVIARAGALAEGGKTMVDRALNPTEAADRRRDAHTIKGNALVMGFPAMAEAAKLLETLFREIAEESRPQTAPLGMAIELVSTALPGSVDGTPDQLMAATRQLRQLVEGGSADEEPSGEPTDDGTAEAPAANTGPISGAAAGARSGPAASVSSETTSAPPPPPPVVEVRSESSTAPAGVDIEVGQAAENFGGLTAELAMALSGETTRVDSSTLYELINKIVELRLDAQAMVAAIGALERDIAQSTPMSGGQAKIRSLEMAATRFYGAISELESASLTLPSVPFGEATSTFPQLVRFLSRRLDKDVALRVVGDEILVDRHLVERLREPLRHLVVNAIAHGLEPADERRAAGKPPTGTVSVEVTRADGQLQVSVSDDGRGIDWEAVAAAAGSDRVDQSVLAAKLFTRGFTTSGDADEVSGDGVGLAMAAELVEALNGGIAVGSQPGAGTTVRLTMPSSLALQGVLVVEAGGHRWGLPIAAVDSTVVVVGETFEGVRYQDTELPVRPLASALGLPETGPAGDVIVLTSRHGMHAFSVPRVLGRKQVAVKDLGPVLGGSSVLGGAAVLGGGQVIGILEPSALVEPAPAGHQVERRHRLLVVDDSRGARQLVAAALRSSGFDVVLAGDAAQAIATVDSERFDAVVCDYSMPGPSGVELVAQIRKRLPRLPVVMVSGVASPEDQSAAYAAGVNAYIDKADFREGALAATLRSLLDPA